MVCIFTTLYDVQATCIQITCFLINAEYRVKCEEGGNYVEAARAHKQFGIVRVQEVRRQQKAVQSRHNLEKEDIQSAHDKQFRDFGVAWNNYMEGNYSFVMLLLLYYHVFALFMIFVVMLYCFDISATYAYFSIYMCVQIVFIVLCHVMS